MDNQDILQRIQALVDEEHRLRGGGDGATAGSPQPGSESGSAEPASPGSGSAEPGDVVSEDAGSGPDDRLARLRQVEEALDQCWDLLRQRRARRESGLDPDAAKLRDATTVERYEA
jgi:hypothetical protein